MESVTRRVTRLALVAVGIVSLLVAVNAVPGAATPPSVGFASQTLGRGTYMSNGDLPLHQGLDVVVSKIVLAPGANSGWHSHPGGAIAIIQQGELTTYQPAGNQCEITRYTQGQSFAERPGKEIIAVNTGSTDTILFVTFPSVPVGGSSRIDEPNPGTCPGI